MIQRIRPKLSFANVMSAIAVFIALGGAGYAATVLPKNSVGTKQLKKGAVTLAKIKRSARAALVGKQGPAGATGPAGPPGSATLGTLPSGQSQTEPWGVGDSNSGEFVPIVFSPPLATGLPKSNLHFMEGKTSASCPGPGEAAPGHLCVYTAPGRNHLPSTSSTIRLTDSKATAAPSLTG